VKYCEQCGAAFRFARVCPRDNVPLTAAVSDPLVGRVLGSRYRILERIGAGGMGQVYRAAHTRISCVFAVKVVWGDFAYDQQMQARFVREAEVASCLSSRNIVRVIDFAEEAGSLPYLVMEYLEGSSLFDVITRHRKLEPIRAIRIAQQICRALAHAHERGVVHRDLKPENVVLVQEDDEADIAKILDFGVARLRDGDRLTSFGVTVGTPLYMSPEQLTGGDLDGRSDLYSLGVVLFEMLTGHPPFQATTIPELTRQHLHEAPPLVQTDDSALPSLGGAGLLAALNDVVHRLLAKNPQHRLSTAREVITALSAVTKDAPVPPSAARGSQVGPTSVLEPAIALRFREAILAGAPRYNAGDQKGCFELYRQTAESVIASAPPIAVSARLRAALTRASKRATTTEAAWDLRYAFDDLLQSGQVQLRGELAHDATLTFLAVAEPRRGPAHAECWGDYLLSFAGELSKQLVVEGRHLELARSLEQSSSTAIHRGAGREAIALLEPFLDILSMGAVTATGATLAVPPRFAAPLLSTTPRHSTPEIQRKIVAAIQVGAPAFNQDQHALCARIYQETAVKLLDENKGDPSLAGTMRMLERALAESSNQGPTDAAWTMRNVFDAILRLAQ
jgi:eukaryotic-like serine/threonine-protein kinase